MTLSAPPPPATDLTLRQYQGWDCCWCGASLLKKGGVSAGISRGSVGAHNLDIEVYACQPCAALRTPLPSIANGRRRHST
jgi:hypothetical protein